MAVDRSPLAAPSWRDHIRDFTSRIASASASLRSPEPPDLQKLDGKDDSGRRTPVVVDLDGFFTPLAEMREILPSAVLACLPLDDLTAARTLILHQLFRSSILRTAEDSRPGDHFLLAEWSVLSLCYAVVGARKAVPIPGQAWKTFYSDDLHQHIRKNYPETRSSTIELTLDRRLVAWTDVPRKRIRVSALTREFLLQINIYLANLAHMVIDDCKTLDLKDSEDFFDFVMAYMLRLHRSLTPAALPIVRPHNRDAMQFAQAVTSDQIVFLMSHEFGHVVLGDGGSMSRHELEWECDSFAFATLSELNISDWQRFLATKWLFGLLAFDRALGECLNFTEGNWGSDIDWIQGDLRERQRDREFASGPGLEALSSHEAVGSAFLIDLKYRLRDLGSERLRGWVADCERTQPMPSGQELTSRVEHVVGRLPADVPISVQRMMGSWNLSSSK
ncbi:hypothetical protein AC1659_26875 [Rhodococcus erythropolis]|uniref:hypothetical protein n=1 Tax=Rhodococcus erythropolis TaxID=1833 RepID=UPI001BAC7F6F|nr:hypothetical protein [Rhodococcus erythropolis]MBS2992921.1 hypothetical protein [Rhodococcus erythropolis]